MVKANGFRWRQAAGAVGVTGFAFSMATTGVMAQEDATPAAGTPPAIEQPAVQSPEGGATAVEKTRLAEAIQGLTDTIALVQADRAAVSSQIDAMEIDGLLTKATELRDAAQVTLQTDDVSTAPQSIMAATQAASAAQALIEAQLSGYGLPSHQGQTSHVLVQAYYAIDEATALTTKDADANAAFFLETAKRLYATAYEQYNAGTFAQAERTAQVALQVAQIGTVLHGDIFAIGGTSGVITSKDGVQGRFEVEVPGAANVEGTRKEAMPGKDLPPVAAGGDFGSEAIAIEPAVGANGPATIEIHPDAVIASPANNVVVAFGAVSDESILVIPEPVFE